MRIQEKAVRDAALISAAAIIVAGVALLSLKTLIISSERGFDAFLPSVALGVVACFTLFVRRHGQAQLALGVYLLAIGGATVILPQPPALDEEGEDHAGANTAAGRPWSFNHRTLPRRAWFTRVESHPLWPGSHCGKLDHWNWHLLSREQVCHQSQP